MRGPLSALRSSAVAALILIVLSSAIVACGESDADPADDSAAGSGSASEAGVLIDAAYSEAALASGDDPAQFEQGRAIYTRVCASCHLADGSGSRTGRSLIDIAVEQPDRTVHVTSVTYGRGEMLGHVNRFTPDELDAVVSYVRLAFTAGAPQPVGGPEAQIYLANCSRCHGATGQGSVEGRSLIGVANEANAGDHTTSVTEGIGTMPAFADTLTADEVAQVVEYVRAAFDA